MTHQEPNHLMTLLLLISSVLATVKVIATSSESRCECTDQLLELPTVQSTFSSNGNSPAYFCGSDLNRLAGSTSSCINDRLYLCSTQNSNSSPTTAAANIGDCPRAKKKSLNGCNDSFKSRNDCLRNLKCTCRNMGRSTPQKVCGQQLVGVDCNPNVIYLCRLIGAPVPLQSCPHECSDGKCIASVDQTITEVSMKEVDKPPPENNDKESAGKRGGSKPVRRSNANSSTSREDHEVEYVTFSPLMHIPLFNP
ncbi:hypothetical protein TYRP_000127 [Tyrophagus putrescentiae]|nr:hypothetical protein TYRP_000127 [Tyrophagus putrescentiae]